MLLVRIYCNGFESEDPGFETEVHSYYTCVRLVYVKVTCLPSFMVNGDRVWEKPNIIYTE